jgi:hypothetical protein
MSKIGVPLSEVHRANISTSLKKFYSIEANRQNLGKATLGRVTSITTRMKQSSGNKGKHPTKRVFCLDTGEVFESLQDASISVVGSFSGKAGISKCCLGRLHTAYGYRWKYVDKEIINGEPK